MEIWFIQISRARVIGRMQFNPVTVDKHVKII